MLPYEYSFLKVKRSFIASNIYLVSNYYEIRPSQVALVVKNLPAIARDVRDTGSIPGLGRSLGIGNCNPLQYSYMEFYLNPVMAL